MKFRTEIDLPHASFGIDHGSGIFMAGSCFSEHISERLRRTKFNVEANPTGILFNPLSICSMIEDLVSGRKFSRSDIRQSSEGLWFSYSHHGQFSDMDAERMLERINAAALRGTKSLHGSDTVIITFGTAWVFMLAESGEVAANCHKQPASCFRRERLTIEQIVKPFEKLFSGVLANKNIVLNISPVRHLSDGADGNSLSKAILRVAAGELVEAFDNVHYFPSFELLCDDLRDYRFYARDMVHPNETAVEYVWEKFCEWCMPQETLRLLPRLEKISAALEHRPLHRDGMAFQRFKDSILRHIDEIDREFPGLDFSEERNRIDKM